MTPPASAQKGEGRSRQRRFTSIFTQCCLYITSGGLLASSVIRHGPLRCSLPFRLSLPAGLTGTQNTPARYRRQWPFVTSFCHDSSGLVIPRRYQRAALSCREKAICCRNQRNASGIVGGRLASPPLESEHTPEATMIPGWQRQAVVLWV